jgi:hypothetical protein
MGGWRNFAAIGRIGHKRLAYCRQLTKNGCKLATRRMSAAPGKLFSILKR